MCSKPPHRGEVCDSRSDLLDNARDVCTEDYGRFEPGGATICPKLCVHGVGSRGDHPDQDLAGFRAWSLDVPLLEKESAPPDCGVTMARMTSLLLSS